MPDKSESSIDTKGLTTEQFLHLAAHAFKKLEWEFMYHAEAGDQIVGITPRSMRSWGEHVFVTVNGDKADILSKCVDSRQVIDWGVNKKNIRQLTETIEELRGRLTPEQLEERPEGLNEKVKEEGQALTKRIEEGTLTPTDKMTLGVGGYYVTYGLMAINILVFIVMLARGVHVMSPTGQDILNWGGNMRQYTVSGEWWRLITSTFVHIGVIHLLMNMYALYSLGQYLEPVMGRWKFLAAYLSTGVLASVTSLAWGADRVSAGASGAIFGIAGVWLMLLVTNYVDKHIRKAMLNSMLVYLGYNLLYGLKGGVDNAAHIGGLVSGMAIGYIFYYMHTKEWNQKVFSAAAIMLTILVTVPVLQHYQNDSAKFYATWDKIAELDEKGTTPLAKRESLSNDEFIQQAEKISLPAYKEMQTLASAMKEYKLPDKAAKQRDLLLSYADLRLQYLQAWIYAEKEQIADYPRLDSIINSMNLVVAALQATQSKQ